MLLESADTLYNLNVLGFFHLDAGDRINGSDGGSRPAINEGLQEARLVGHFSSQLGQRVSAFMEVELTAAEDDNTLHVERIMLKYDLDNYSQISVGRFHAPVGFWNQYYHHGRWLQTTIDRPLQTEFGGTFLPGHYWGGMYERHFSAGTHNIVLDVGYGAGRDASIEAPALNGPVRSDQGFMLQINVMPARHLGWGAGGSLWLGDLQADGRNVEERIMTGHVTFHSDSAALLSEIAVVQHDYPDSRGVADNYAAYVEYSRKLPGSAARVTPYVRYDYSDIDEVDAVFSALRSRDRQSLGARYELTDFSAIKLEVRRDHFRVGGQSARSVQTQYSAVFW
jgi:hypothetical protein